MIVRFAILLIVVVLAGCGGRGPSRVALPPESFGLRADAFAALDAALLRATANGQVPGAALSVGRDGRIIYENTAGFRDLRPSGAMLPVTRETLFDVASLAKPLTAAAVLLADARGDLAIDASPWPSGPSHARLLYHVGGMPATVDWGALDPREPLLDQLAELRDADAGVSHAYSNAGYLALSLSLEDAVSVPLEQYISPLFGALGMSNTTWRPAPGTEVARTAEDVEPGTPFDPLASAVVQAFAPVCPGHSGLFSTAGDLNRLAQAMLFPQIAASVPEWEPVARRLVWDARELRTINEKGGVTVTIATTRRTPAFEAPAGSCERAHTGYTGCVMWLDPSRGLSYVLLTNSVHGPDDDGWRALDAAVRDALLDSDQRPPNDCVPQ